MLEHLSAAAVRPDRVVVVGAGGFVGRAVMRAVARDDVPALGVTRASVDLLDADAGRRLAALLRPSDAVVLVSAVAPARSAAHVTQNLRMAEAWVAALGAAPVAHVVYVSSDAVYADGDGLITEHSCAEPSSLHGAMHLAREVVLKTAVKAPLAILRPSLLYGPGDPHNSYGPNRFRRLAARGDPIVLFGQGEEQRDHVWIEDAGSIVALTLAHRSRGVLNVATGTSLSFRVVADTVAAVTPRPVEIRITPRQGPIVHRHFDTTACMKVFPAFRYAALEDGLRRTVREEAADAAQR
jgi:UDP-glucose 4-epimerase